MKNKKTIIYILVVFIMGTLIGGFIISLTNKSKESTTSIVSNNISEDAHKKNISGYSFESTDKNIINKELKGEYLDSFVTVAEMQDEFTVNVKGVESSSNIFLINHDTGEMVPMEYNNGEFSVKVNLDKDITYGIIMDYKLVGSIRVVEDLNTVNQDQLFRDILISMGCGL